MYKILFFSFLFVACFSPKREDVFTAAENLPQEIAFTEVVPVSVCLDSIPTSYLGKVITYKDCLLFIDEKFCYAYLFDRSGKLLKRCLGKGHSPKEIPVDEITGYCVNNREEIVIFSDLLYFVYDSTFTLKYYNTVKTHTRSPHQPKRGDNPFIYSWPYDKFVIHGYDSTLYYTAINKAFSYITESRKFFSECFTILQVDAPTGVPEKVLGPYPPIYQERSFCQFPYCSFDLDSEGNVYVCYEADSLIYKFDKRHKNIRTFGQSGRDMDCDYIALSHQASLRSLYLQERATRGFYDQVLYVDSLNWLCRVYQKGGSALTDGLQVYDSTYRLIADCDIPKGFRLCGYISPCLYFYKVEEETEKILSFKLSFCY
ncbi:hypothetical protein [Odoribacter lunatus]|uniref:hypothetical protein n=1 Tax=Odoribacter lunatus TaxID=2941335 RepID=UPI00203F4D80|nr:hypothetical protein [Odoribacter lunatus]